MTATLLVVSHSLIQGLKGEKFVQQTTQPVEKHIAEFTGDRMSWTREDCAEWRYRQKSEKIA
jgi:hypothetical protein